MLSLLQWSCIVVRKSFINHHQGLWGAHHGCERLRADPVQNNNESHDHRAIHIRLNREVEHVVTEHQRTRCGFSLLPHYPCHLLAITVADLAASSPETALDTEAGAVTDMVWCSATSCHGHFSFMPLLQNRTLSHWEELMWPCPLALAFFWCFIAIPLVVRAEDLAKKKNFVSFFLLLVLVNLLASQRSIFELICYTLVAGRKFWMYFLGENFECTSTLHLVRLETGEFSRN